MVKIKKGKILLVGIVIIAILSSTFAYGKLNNSFKSLDKLEILHGQNTDFSFSFVVQERIITIKELIELHQKKGNYLHKPL